MRKILISLFAIFAIMAKAQNPFYSEFTGPHSTPLFSQINNQNMAEAIDHGIEQARAEVDAIANNPNYGVAW